MAFSPSDAAFEGFRLARRRPVMVATLSVVSLLSGLAMIWVMSASGYLTAVQTMSRNPGDTSGAVAMLGSAFNFMIGVALLSALSAAIQAGAIYRGVLRPNVGGVTGLALSGDEVRLFGLALVMGLLSFFTALIVAIVLAIIIAVAGGAAMKVGDPSQMIAMMGFIYGVMGVVFATLGTKLSLAGPATVARRRLTVFGSWSMTKGHFWNLLGCYALTFFLATLVYFIVFVVALVAASLFTGEPFMNAFTELVRPTPAQALDLFSPVRLVQTIVSGLFGGVISVIWNAPAAEAYRQLRPEAADQAEVFG